MARFTVDNREPKRQSHWTNLMLPSGLLFALLGYVWIGENQTVAYALMLTGLFVGIVGMVASIQQEGRDLR